MATTILGLTTGTMTAKLSAVKYNQVLYSEDRLARVLAYPRNLGVIAGLQLTANKSTVTSGQAIVGPFYCAFTGSQVISGLTAGAAARRYIYARADGGSPASGTVDIVARTTSAALLNPDGVTYATRLGYVVMSTNKVSGVYNSGNANFPRDKVLTISANKAVLPGGAKLYTSGTAASLVVTAGSFRALGGVLHLSTDTYLARSGANTLVTSDPLRVGGSLHLTTSAHVGGSGANTARWRGNVAFSGVLRARGSLAIGATSGIMAGSGAGTVKWRGSLKLSGTHIQNGDMYFLGAGNGLPYGDIHAPNITWANGAPASQTWKPISTASWQANQTNLTALTGNAGVKVTYAGKYLVNWNTTLELSTANKHVRVGPMVNAASQAFGRAQVEALFANQEMNAAGNCILNLAANDKVKLGVAVTDGTPSCTVRYATLAVTMIGG